MEQVDVVDEEDRVLRQASRADVRRYNLLHRVASILCRRSDGRVYVHRRTDAKDVWPGLYDMLAGGVVTAGESYATAAARELAEELGVDATPRRVLHHLYLGPEVRSHIELFEVTWDGAITPQQSEVAWGQFCRPETIDDNPQGWVFVPDSAAIWKRYRALRS